MALIAELLLVRHGQAHCNLDGLVGGEQTCTGLTSHGRDQLARLAVRLRGLHQANTPMRTLLDRHAGQRILIAAHGETIQAAHLLLLGLPCQAWSRVEFATDHAGLARWQLHRNRYGRIVWTLAAHNDTAHLAGSQP